ncbi:MAG: AMP-binding protein [Sphingobium sp.]
MSKIDGAMQDYALTLDKILDHAAKWHPDTEVVTAAEGQRVHRISYAGLRDNAMRVSAALAQIGVRRGDRVATLAWNTLQHLECWYGIMNMGAVCHTLNPRLTADQLAWMVNQSEPVALVISSDLACLAEEVMKLSGRRTTRVFTMGGAAGAFGEDLSGIVAGTDREVLWGDFDENAPCGLCFTSGTTGAPKGVSYTHRANFLHSLRQLQADVMGITSRDVVLPVVPMFHANAWGLPFACPAAGAKLVLPGRNLDGAHLARLIGAEGVTIAAGVPTVWFDVFDYLDRSGTDVPSLKRIIVGGAPTPPALVARMETRGIEVQTTWGMTELSPLGTASPPGIRHTDPALSGRPALGLDLMLTDHDGVMLEQQRGKEGSLWVRGPAVVERYFGQEQSTTSNGWFPTGDLATIDGLGNLQITGRSKDLIKSGGEWINPAEIEAAVAAHPSVSLAAVIGCADPKWGERPLLLVELREDEDPSDDDLIAVLRGKIANWWIPKEIVRIRHMPLAATGKIDKLRLRDEYCRR